MIDAREAAGVLESLYGELALAKEDIARDALHKSEEHYLTGRWRDCINNSRIFLEGVLQEVAAARSQRVKGKPLAERVYKQAAPVRDYLEQEGLLETKEREALQYVYGLLSNTGSHP